MTTTTQHAAPEDVMALLDGELSAAEAPTITDHIADCPECAALADQFRQTSQAVAGWTVPDVPNSLEARIKAKSGQSTAKRPAPMRLLSPGWKWSIGGGCVVTVLFLFAMFQSATMYRTAHLVAPEPHAEMAATMAPPPPPPPPLAAKAKTESQFYDDPASPNMAALQTLDARRARTGVVNGALENPTAMTAAPPNSSAPMIARIVSLTIQVKDITITRQALDALLAHYQGYAADLTINTPEGSARSFSASLRIPAPVLSASLADLRNLGRVQNESQSGEEVTQQHADLVARLRNARETEQRLLAILEKRTGKVEEILQVEEQISNTRGDIERMEAEQKALEHRVDFATVQLQLAEEYKAQLSAPSTSVATRMRNSLVSGLGNAGSSILGIVLFFVEYGPVMLVWFVVLGTPAWFLWRRYRNVQNRI